ncbi:hypothetical protein L227DRAFT_590680 [Lentinus tigrinus ALCF2SS1-6]|uniref:Zinc finger Mcm10/DnaG-type domain-containing protein n=1 Tax=Lentinus tigrinus ALCF2SS1-6 TaxID=1328759 RepID=A0A5C2SPX9_9APHY|nr:hypothetical protein L227DRAFT_590680 [Lentinus tigrinus ALCF2SS1-6]
MDSATSKKTAEQERQAEIRRQIALLQAQLGDTAHTEDSSSEQPSKRKTQEPHVLIPGTPSKRRKIAEQTTTSKPIPQAVRNKAAPTHTAFGPSFPLQKPNNAPPPAASSTVLQKLAQAHSQKSKGSSQEVITRSNSFAARPPPLASPPEHEAAESSARDDNLALIEDLLIGPTEHKPPFDDPHFEKLEPNSGIRLLSRAIPHDDFQDYLRGRYYLSPSKLYSVVRLLPNKQGYDVPVCGDWLTIAVVAERGQMKFTRAPVGVSRDDGAQRDDDRMDELPPLDGPPQAQAGPSRPFQRKKPQDDGPKHVGKKYVNMKLIDFGCRSRGSSADGGKAKIRGDAYLSLLLFESDSFDVLTKDDGTKEKVYRGGSRGAFERMSKLREGAVVALLNPKILKPFQRSADTPHPTENILALTPESDASIAVIGYAQDLGRCSAMKRDGTRCGSWCDKRVSEVCDFHIQTAVQRARASRPEFSVGTSGMTSSAKKKPAYDPARQWGLKPETQASSATYVVSGHVISGGESQSMYIGETVGREAQAKAARKLAADSDKALQRLLSRDREGTKALVSAREFAKRKAEAAKDQGKRGSKGKVKDKGKGKMDSDSKEPQTTKSGAAMGESGEPATKKNGYSAELIKQLGFDPSAKDGRPGRDANVQSKLDALAAIQAKRKIELGRAGKRLSCVRRPDESGLARAKDEVDASGEPRRISDLESDDDELEKEEVAAFGRAVGLEEAMVDLDGSDSES